MCFEDHMSHHQTIMLKDSTGAVVGPAHLLMEHQGTLFRFLFESFKRSEPDCMEENSSWDGLARGQESSSLSHPKPPILPKRKKVRNFLVCKRTPRTPFLQKEHGSTSFLVCKKTPSPKNRAAPRKPTSAANRTPNQPQTSSAPWS